ncbi:tyrosine-type recombinase/integrase [Laribacter hongkongensis]|uniref:Integrase arm-type DNA-binding domain-containing protein n=1 Tax=Laribacter hongkongensis TaxID=168471 RepID=A0ABD4SXK3_9NEIS|nr:integrase arm-type DNA-binding domain-containing protein [Laribacter hongkongensis]MCG9027376.1 integrase arm-type DNA-binding domain-containing protein [Laribacter hongkongensis]
MRLTDKTIRSAKPQDKPYKLADGGGLYLEVSPAGNKVWRMKYRVGGKEKKLTIGAYPGVSLFDAREAAMKAKRALSDGSDPAREKQAAMRAARLAEINTFEAVSREWQRLKVRTLTPIVSARLLAEMEKDVFPQIGKRPVSALTPGEVLDCVRRVEKRSPYMAANTLQRIRAVMRYAVQLGLAANNPASELTGVVHVPRAQKRPALSRGEIREFFQRTVETGMYYLTQDAFRLLMLTFVRPGELCGAKWCEFDMVRAEWRIPPERMKMREAHVVPLSRQALAVLERLQERRRQSPYVFPSVSAKAGHLWVGTLSRAMIYSGFQDKATPHGFRALASTVLNEEGFPPDVIERQLAHAERNKVRAAYHRAEYMADRRRMMQWWADFIDRQVAAA